MIELDRTEHAFYSLQAKYEIIRNAGTSFQDFFVEVGSHRWGTDFEGRRPQGRKGDRKCDGYHVPTETVYQCYAPRNMDVKELIKKIKEDFQGAFDNKEQTPMKVWILVHNDFDELPTDAHELIIKLRNDHKGSVDLKVMGPTILLGLIMEISPNKLKLLFPHAISSVELRKISYADIDALIDELDPADSPPPASSLEPPSINKLSHNGFSPAVVSLLQTGLIVQPKFEHYFRQTSRTRAGDNLAEKFKKLYAATKGSAGDADQKFFEIVDAVGGLAHEPKRRAAILGLTSYLFHTCEIFENPPDGVSL